MTSSAPRGDAHPNRPYYKPSDDSGAFIATTAPRYSANTSSGTNAATQRSSNSGNLSLPPASNRYSSSIDEIGGSESSSYASNLSEAGMALLYSTALQYTSTCLAMPFEVGKLLLQVQWVPKDEVWMAFGEAEKDDEMKLLNKSRRDTAGQTVSPPIGRNEWVEGEQGGLLEGEQGGISRSDREEWQDGEDDEEDDLTSEKPDFGGEKDELSDEDEAEAYFRDLSSTSSRPLDLSRESGRRRRKQTDSYGYVLRKSIHEDVTRPEFVMPIVVRGGVWEMIKAVGRGKEGWLGLWKGEYPTLYCRSKISS
jgi:fusion and transport protein UGO1